MIAVIVSVVALSVVGLAVLLKKSKAENIDLLGRHVMITGGSSGIGKCMAIRATRAGANVTVIARNRDRLQSTLEEIKTHSSDHNQKFNYLSVDLAGDFDLIKRSIDNAIEQMGPPYLFVNCAGMALCGTLEDNSPDDIRQMINTNLISTIQATKAVINEMKRNGYGHIAITSSLASFCGIYGLSVYSATKFALRGFAEALHMEVKNYGIQVTLALPPDTDTPGYANENKSKPLETMLISETANLLTPEEVGNKILQDTLAGKFFSTLGFEGYAMTLSCAGMAPFSSYSELLFQVFGAGVLRLICIYYLHLFDKIIKKCKLEKEHGNTNVIH